MNWFETIFVPILLKFIIGLFVINIVAFVLGWIGKEISTATNNAHVKRRINIAYNLFKEGKISEENYERLTQEAMGVVRVKDEGYQKTIKIDSDLLKGTIPVAVPVRRK